MAQAREKFGIQPLPDIQRAKADAVLFLENAGDPLRGRANEAEGNVPAHAEREAGECRNLSPRHRARCVLAVFALDGPILAGVGFRDEVDALVIGGKAEFFPQGGWNILQKPDRAQLRGVFRIEQKVGANEMLEHIALFLFGQPAESPNEILPRRTTRDRLMQSGMEYAFHSAVKSEARARKLPKSQLAFQRIR